MPCLCRVEHRYEVKEKIDTGFNELEEFARGASEVEAYEVLKTDDKIALERIKLMKAKPPKEEF